MGASGIDLWRSIVVSAEDDQDVGLETLYQVIDQLPTAERARLAKHLIGASDLSVTFGDGSPTDFIVAQIQAMNRDELGDILNAIASRIKTEGR